MLEKIKEHALSIRPTFEYACNNGDIEEVQKYLEEGYDCSGNAQEVSIASKEGYLEIVCLLLRHGADCTAWSNYAIREASKNGYLEIVRLLLENRADCAAKDHAIELASDNEHLEVIRLLLENGANCTTRHNHAIRIASKNGVKLSG
jgi:ankyrin repeat protein